MALPFIPRWSFQSECDGGIVFRRKRNETKPYRFKLFRVDENGVRTPLDCTGLTVRLKAMGPMPKPTPKGVDPTLLPVVLNGMTSAVGDPVDGDRTYTPASGERDLYGDYLVEVWLNDSEKIPGGYLYWKIESGDDVTTP